MNTVVHSLWKSQNEHKFNIDKELASVFSPAFYICLGAAGGGRRGGWGERGRARFHGVYIYIYIYIHMYIRVYIYIYIYYIYIHTHDLLEGGGGAGEGSRMRVCLRAWCAWYAHV